MSARIVYARPPSRIKRKPAEALPTRIVVARKPGRRIPMLWQTDPLKAAEAADRLWLELVRRVMGEEQASAQFRRRLSPSAILGDPAADVRRHHDSRRSRRAPLCGGH
jgi:hypothetical protein